MGNRFRGKNMNSGFIFLFSYLFSWCGMAPEVKMQKEKSHSELMKKQRSDFVLAGSAFSYQKWVAQFAICKQLTVKNSLWWKEGLSEDIKKRALYDCMPSLFVQQVVRHNASIKTASFNAMGDRILLVDEKDNAIVFSHEKGYMRKKYYFPCVDNKKLIDASFSSDGSAIIMATNDLSGGTVKIFSSNKGYIQKTYSIQSKITCAKLNGSDNKTIIADDARTVHIIHAHEDRSHRFAVGQQLNTFDRASGMGSIVGNDSGKSIEAVDIGEKIFLLKTDSGAVSIYSAEDGKPLCRLMTDGYRGNSFEKFDQVKLFKMREVFLTKEKEKKKEAVVTSSKGLYPGFVVWSNEGGSINKSCFPITDVKASPDGSLLVGHVTHFNKSYIFGTVLSPISVLKYEIPYILKSNGVAAFSPDSKKVAIVHGTMAAIINTAIASNKYSLHADDFKCKYVLNGHLGEITDINFSPCGNYVLTGSKDCTARIWNVERNYENDVKELSSDDLLTLYEKSAAFVKSEIESIFKK